MSFSHNFVDIEGVNIHYVDESPCHSDRQETVETIVFLHGFPELWQVWTKQLDHFKSQYRVIAPDLPGYNLSDKPNDEGFYQLPNLIGFISKFIATVAPNQSVTLVAHDWGGAIAWPLAAFTPNIIKRLVILNAAHPSTYTRELKFNPQQQQKSAYINTLISADAESLLFQNDFAYLKETIEIWPQMSPASQLKYTKAWQQQGAVSGMLAYYKAMPHHPPAASNQDKIVTNIKVPNIHVHCPTLILWGENDKAFCLSTLSGIEEYVSDAQVIRFTNTSHWVQHEKPHEISEAIEQFMQG